MTYFNEENTVEQMVLDTLANKDGQWCVAEPQADYLASHLTLHTSRCTLHNSAATRPGGLFLLKP